MEQVGRQEEDEKEILEEVALALASSNEIDGRTDDPGYVEGVLFELRSALGALSHEDIEVARKEKLRDNLNSEISRLAGIIRKVH